LASFPTYPPASRPGGLPFTVAAGATGLLCKPGEPVDLALKLTTLLDDRELRERLGLPAPV